MMSAFAKWYVAKLKSHPMLANMCSALVLMAMGDAAAQEIEIHNVGGAVLNSKTSSELRGDEEDLAPKKLSFRRYGTLSPNVPELQAQLRREREEDQAARALLSPESILPCM